MDETDQFSVSEAIVERARLALGAEVSLGAFSEWGASQRPLPIIEDGEEVGDNLDFSMLTFTARHTNGRRAAAIVVVHRYFGDDDPAAAFDWVVGSARERFEELHAEA